MRPLTELDQQIATDTTMVSQEPTLWQPLLLGPVDHTSPRRSGLPVRISDPQPPTRLAQPLQQFLDLDPDGRTRRSYRSDLDLVTGDRIAAVVQVVATRRRHLYPRARTPSGHRHQAPLPQRIDGGHLTRRHR